MIWRVRFRGRWLYVYFLLEFQSAVDRFMAVRVMTYVGLLYQDLARRKELIDDMLPPVVPIVLHAGDQPWNAATDVGDLVHDAPSGLDRWRPRISYLLLEERLLTNSTDPSLRNLAGALFRLEHDRDPRAILEVVNALAIWLGAPEQAELRRAFETMLTRVLQPMVETEPAPLTLTETQSMLETQLENWERHVRERCLAEGRAIGEKIGLAEGLAEGRAEGRAEGEAVGVIKGQAALVVYQLERRFGRLDDTVRGRVLSASQSTLILYSERLLDAADIESVFRE